MGTDPQQPPRISFSVDRILSRELGPPQPQPQLAPPDERRDWSCCERALRCCQPFLYQPHHLLQQAALLHAPRPIRPFPPKFQVKVSYERLGGLRESEDPLSGGKRKRSWSRAVFSSLQRKGLEKRFQLQQYITKPDRRQLAATLGLTDAQVKVWFQNRRMKWRHTKEMKGGGVPCQQRLTASGPPQPTSQSG